MWHCLMICTGSKSSCLRAARTAHWQSRSVTYTELLDYVDHPAVIIPTGQVQPTDAADTPDHARYGSEDEQVYSYYESLGCMHISCELTIE